VKAAPIAKRVPTVHHDASARVAASAREGVSKLAVSILAVSKLAVSKLAASAAGAASVARVSANGQDAKRDMSRGGIRDGGDLPTET